MHVKAGLLTSVSAVVIVLTLGITLSWQRPQTINLIGTDISWPNCEAKPNSSQGTVGATGGLDFTVNKCLRFEAAEFPNLALYMNTGWPGTDFHLKFKNSPRHCHQEDGNCLAYNYGFNAAKYAIDFANSQLVHSSNWWLDVETDNSWTNDLSQNQSAIVGMIAAVKQNIPWAQVGIYAYPGQWSELLGNWRPDLPAWVATASVSLRAAKLACRGTSFTGGPVVLAQYTPLLDQNLKCTN